jgi:hypothetical protein
VVGWSTLNIVAVPLVGLALLAVLSLRVRSKAAIA